MVSEKEIRRKLLLFLENEVSLDEFEDWFVVGSWNAHREGDPAALRMISAIELMLAEHSSGHLSDTQLRKNMLDLIAIQHSTATSLPPHSFVIHSLKINNLLKPITEGAGNVMTSDVKPSRVEPFFINPSQIEPSFMIYPCLGSRSVTENSVISGFS